MAGEGAGATGATGAGANGGVGASAGAGAQSNAGDNSGGATSPPQGCDPTAAPEAEAIFVSPAGLDSNAGSAQLPVKTLSTALTKAKANLAKRIYLQVGDYSEASTLVFTEAEGGIIIEGGWNKQGAKWSPACADDRRLSTTIAVASNVAVRVTDVAVASALRHLTLATKAQGISPFAQPGESMYGIWVSGATTVFNLNDVEVIAGNAGSGGDAPIGPNGVGPALCTGLAACCTDGIAGCGNAQVGPTAPPGAPVAPSAAQSGAFHSSGYAGENGPAGANGPNGYNGKAGGAGTSGGNVCRVGGSCGKCQTGGNASCPGTCGPKVAPTSYSPLVGETGHCGCGGLGGFGGQGGRGGGASIALYVTTGATVVVKDSVLRAGKGGNGAAGGVGGEGALGSDGSVGAPAFCITSCYDGCQGSCTCDQGTSVPGGAAGTRGGKGAKGGQGGGGSGGPSHAVVTLAGSVDDVGGNQLVVSDPGVGFAGGANGQNTATLSLN